MVKRSAVNDIELPAEKKQTIEQKNEDFIKSGRLLETGEFSDVEVIVGRDGVTHSFKLHKAILVQNSGYFRRILKSDAFIEGQTSIINLPEHMWGTFWFIVHWLYNGEFYNRAPVDISSQVRRISYALYFDIPSLLPEVVEDLAQRISKSGQRAKCQPGERLSDVFVEGIANLFELYHTQAKALDSIICAICQTGYLKRIMTDDTLRPLLQEEPELMGRIIKIQLGLGKKYDDQMEQMDLLKELESIDSL